LKLPGEVARFVARFASRQRKPEACATVSIGWANIEEGSSMIDLQNLQAYAEAHSRYTGS
jgi:hypothetical protein